MSESETRATQRCSDRDNLQTRSTCPSITVTQAKGANLRVSRANSPSDRGRPLIPDILTIVRGTCTTWHLQSSAYHAKDLRLVSQLPGLVPRGSCRAWHRAEHHERVCSVDVSPKIYVNPARTSLPVFTDDLQYFMAIYIFRDPATITVPWQVSHPNIRTN